jgi:hypothetical protein
MPATLLTSDAKEALRKKIRLLRPLLLDQLLDAAKGEYRLEVSIEKAKLPEARHRRRERLEAWLLEQGRGCADQTKKAKGNTDALRDRFLLQAVKEAAHTWLNRLVMLRILEQHGLMSPAVLTGGWKSAAYEQEFIHYVGPLAEDDTRGYRDLLETVFGELALELPGLFGPVGLVNLFPIPTALLRELVEALNDPALDTAWGDDMTLGWIYQYWNDPEREQLDAKITDGGKIEPHEIASKTQMFTERYMVEWLLQNSLGLTWLSICKKNGWRAEAEGVVSVLDERRAAFRKQREAGELALDALMPIHGALEDAWKYYVPQPIPEDAVAKAPPSIREVKLLDPACGSGHFLVSAFGLFVAMYTEEAKNRGETWSSEQIAEDILANNLYGIDIDARAIQIAAAALWLKAKLTAPNAKLARMNLVAPCFRLGSLPKDDPAVTTLYQELDALGVPAEATRKIVESLNGVDHLGTLLRVGSEITAITSGAEIGSLFAWAAGKKKIEIETAIAQYLDAHSTEADLGLRLEGEQLAAGLRFVRLVKEGTYDVVVGNPPYQGLSKTTQFDYVTKNYSKGKADLYAAFLERGLELVRAGGCSALITIRGWMFLGQFQDLRKEILAKHRLVLGDLGWGAFEDMTDNPVTMSVIQRDTTDSRSSALSPADPTARVRTDEHRRSLAAGLLIQAGRYEFDPKGFAVIDGEPIVYWWTKCSLREYERLPKLGEKYTIRKGLTSGNDVRFIRLWWESRRTDLGLFHYGGPPGTKSWMPYFTGGTAPWIQPLLQVIRWTWSGAELAHFARSRFGRGASHYFRTAVGFSMIGSGFSARAHRYPSVLGDKGGSVFPECVADVLPLMNSRWARGILESLNPTVCFQVSDLARLPLRPIESAPEVWERLETEFTAYESTREPSVEFKSPGPSPWRYAQDWAQRSVDRAENEPLPPYTPEYDEAAPEADVSFAVGVALGRFGAHGEGILEAAPESALPAGILFVSPSETLSGYNVAPGVRAACFRVGQATNKNLRQ